jgi:alpha-tubulin suppressor-like RCC1 family protein
VLANGQADAKTNVRFTSIDCGKEHTVALKEDGTIYCWGSYNIGQCSVPKDLRGVTQIAAGFYFTAALKNDRTAYMIGFTGEMRPVFTTSERIGQETVIIADND